MSNKFIIGAPSITGIDANNLVEQFFTNSKFPLMVRLTNHLQRNVSLPEIGVFLPAFEGKADAKIKSLDALHQVVSSIEQISELNEHEAAITVEDLTPEPAPASKSSTKTVATATDTGA